MSATVLVRVTPRSSRQKIAWENGKVRAWVHAAPTDGQANEAVLRLLSEVLGVPISSISIIRGHASREKAVLIPSVSLEQIREKLEDR